MSSRILKCSYPFPDQDPSVEVSQPCASCPNADRATLDQHTSISKDDPELLATIKELLRWFFVEDKDHPHFDEVAAHASSLYTSIAHTGMCVPKAVLFAVYRLRQYDSYVSQPRLTAAAEKAARGEQVASWPEGMIRRTLPWSGLFRWYNLHHATPEGEP